MFGQNSVIELPFLEREILKKNQNNRKTQREKILIREREKRTKEG